MIICDANRGGDDDDDDVDEKEGWRITRLEKVSGCLRTLQSLHKKAWGHISGSD